MLRLVESDTFKWGVYLNIPVMAASWLTVYLVHQFEGAHKMGTYKLGISVVLISCAVGWMVSFPYHFEAVGQI